MSCATTRVKKPGKDHLDAYRSKAWHDKYACRKGVEDAIEFMYWDRTYPGNFRRASSRCRTVEGEYRHD